MNDRQLASDPLDRSASGPSRATELLLVCGIVAGPLYVLVSLAQAVTRSGFDPSRHEWSLLANGSLGWIQITNLLVSGAMTVAAAVGIGRTVRTGAGSRWGPRLIAGYGLGMIGAGFFRADPTDGFPPGTPAGKNPDVSWHAGLHLLCAGLGFLALVAACLVLARWFGTTGRRRWEVFSRVTGIVFLAAFVGIAAGAGNRAVNLAFTAAVILGCGWVSAVSGFLLRRGEHLTR